MDIHSLYDTFLQHPSAETDTRKIKKGDIFFALKGPNFNGNQYARRAFEAGAAYCVCDEITEFSHEKILFVDDVLTALQQLAKTHREQLHLPVIAITGSNGKTTTKELVHEVLSAKYTCYTTRGNLNNHIGIPLTILAIKKDAEIAVIEMGANHLHEIEGYCKYALPTHGLITNCGKAHLEGFGDLEGVKKAKGELYDFIAANNGIAFINNDYDYLREMSRNITQKISYGTTGALFTGHVKEDRIQLEVAVTAGAIIPSIKTQLAGNYNLPNVLSAVCIGKTFGVTDEAIKFALEHYTPGNSRSQILQAGSNRIVLDAYNANPGSMKAAIENFAVMEADKKIVILGGMKELGAESVNEHSAIIRLLQQYRWNEVVLAGEDYRDVPPGYHHFTNAAETADWYRAQHFENALILIKGSRGMAMEKVLE